MHLYPEFLLATSLRLVPCPQGSFSKGSLVGNHPRHKIIRDLHVTVWTDIVQLGKDWGIARKSGVCVSLSVVSDSL